MLGFYGMEDGFRVLNFFDVEVIMVLFDLSLFGDCVIEIFYLDLNFFDLCVVFFVFVFLLIIVDVIVVFLFVGGLSWLYLCG